MKLKQLCVFALCAAVLVAGVACKSGSSDSMTAEQIIQNMEAVSLDFRTVHYEMAETLYGTVQSMGEESIVDMVVNMSGDIDYEHTQMYIDMVTTMNTTTGGDTESETTDVQMYMVDGWMYAGMELYGQEVWVKTELTDDMWDEQITAMYQSEELLKDAINVSIVGQETVNGVLCWKLDINPDTARIMDWVESQMGEDLGELPSDVNDMDVIVWVAKDTYYTTRVYTTMAVNYEGDAVDISVMTNYSRFNQPLNITLPEEASEAIDFSGLENQQ